jgi:hypothetical protein
MSGDRIDRSAAIAARIRERFRRDRSDRRACRAQSEMGVTRLSGESAPVYTVHCTVYCVQCTQYTVQCTVVVNACRL